MRALWWDGTEARVVERPTPEVTSDMALVRMRLAGVCNTDLELVKGYMDFRGVLGHELSGTVAEGPAPWPGRRVVTEINFACARCAWCRQGLQRHCPQRKVMGILGADGAFADLVAVPVTNLHAVPDDVSDEAAVFTEPLAAAFEILDQVTIEPGTDALVLGDGKLGLLVAQVLHYAGARVLAVGKHESKIAHLRRRGINAVTVAQWKRAPAALVVEATGSAAGFSLAVEMTQPRGTLVLKSTTAVNAAVNLAPIVINEITVVGSRCGRFAPALRALSDRSVDVESLVSAQVPLARAAEALALAQRADTLKILIRNDAP